MWAYCTDLSGAEAYLRIAAARAAREHPVILGMLADGRLHLSAVARIAPHLTSENREALLQRATHKSKREIDELVAELEPRPDVPATIRKVPDRLPQSRLDGPQGADRTISNASVRASSPVTSMLALTASAPVTSGVALASVPAGVSLRLDEVLSCRSAKAVRPGTIEPLAPARYKVQFTASAALKEKLERLQALMRSSVPDVDLAKIIDAAVTEKLERLEARRFGRTSSPRKDLAGTDTRPSSRKVPAAVRRAVHERDEGRCRFVDEQGRRCTARARLELHHRHPFALGGDHSPGNVATLCRVHNRYLAEVDFGRKAIENRRGWGAPPQEEQLLLT